MGIRIDSYPGKPKIPQAKEVGVLATTVLAEAGRVWKPVCRNRRKTV